MLDIIRKIYIIVINPLSTIINIGQQLVSETTNLKLNKKDQKMYGFKYESIRIPVLNKDEYPT